MALGLSSGRPSPTYRQRLPCRARGHFLLSSFSAVCDWYTHGMIHLTLLMMIGRQETCATLEVLTHCTLLGTLVHIPTSGSGSMRSTFVFAAGRFAGSSSSKSDAMPLFNVRGACNRQVHVLALLHQERAFGCEALEAGSSSKREDVPAFKVNGA